MQTKTNELTGAALDWAVAKCEGLLGPDGRLTEKYCDFLHHDQDGGFTDDWAQGGPIIEREQLNIACFGDVWEAWPNTGMSDDIYCKGPTPLIAAMRCYVASKLGDTVDIPEELIK